MPAALFTSSPAADVRFGIVNDTGIILSGYSRQVGKKKVEVVDALGDIVASAYTETSAKIKLEGIINGSNTFTVGALYSLANSSTGYGLTGGTVIIDSVSESSGAGEFKKISVELTQYERVMTAPVIPSPTTYYSPTGEAYTDPTGSTYTS